MARAWRRENSTWAAGSYVDIFNANAVMQIAWMITAAILLFTDERKLLELDNTIYLIILFSTTLSLFLMMPIGIAFDIFPFIHGIAPFEETVMKVYVWCNSAGQLAFIIALFVSDSEIQNAIGQIAITLIAISLAILGPSAMRTVSLRTRKASGPTCHYLSGLILPFIALLSLITWIQKDNEMVLHIATVFLIDIFWMLISVNLLLGHFHRRLQWDLLTEKENKIMLIIFLLAIVTHMVSSIGEAGEMDWWNSKYRLSLTLVIGVVLVLVNPMKILKYAWIEKRPNNDLLVLGLLWLFIAFFVSIYEIIILDRVTFVSRVILFVGVGLHCVWGFSGYLHLDHKHARLEDRSQAKNIRRSLNVALLTFLALYLQKDSLQNEFGVYHYLMFALLGYSIASTFLWWVANSFFTLEEWNRIPMFYSEMVGEYEAE